jgi:hypothetical protein
MIRDVRVGLGYTGVLLDDESCGLGLHSDDLASAAAFWTKPEA